MIAKERAGEEASNAFLSGRETIARASSEGVAMWLKDAMARLEAVVSEQTLRTIMEECGYNCAQVNKKHIERMKSRRSKYETVDAFLEAEERSPAQGTRVERRGDIAYQYYTPRAFRGGMRCYCSLWRGLPEDQSAPGTWCYCSRGFVTKVWEAYLGWTPRVELLESCISGGEECKFAVHLKP